MTEADPIIENWYEHEDKGQCFQIIAIDQDKGIVAIQHFDGDVEEIELKEWYRLEVKPSDEPENWSGPMDIGETDDYGTEVTDTQAQDWNEPLQDINPVKLKRELKSER